MAKKDNEKKQKKHYFRDMKAELKKVIWPTPKQLINNTLAVIAFTLIAAVIVFVLDLCFDSINKYGIVPLQEKIQEAYSSATESSEEETSDESEEEASDETEEDSSEDTEVEEVNAISDDSVDVEVESEDTSEETTSDEDNSEANVEE